MFPLLLNSTPRTAGETPAPRQDFVLLADALGASLLYPAERKPTSLLSRLEERTATDIRQAFAALKRRHGVSAYISLSERVGIPLALLLPKHRQNRPAHVLIGHRLTSSNKRKLHERTGYLHRFDHIVVLASPQSEYLRQKAGYSANRVSLISDAVDEQFWTETGDPPTSPELDERRLQGTRVSPNTYLLAVGRERRDYATFADALRQMPETRAVVVASSPWSRTSDSSLPRDIPPNMTFYQNLSYIALRDLYGGTSLVVVPLEAGTDYAAGVNGCLEAMAMAKPVLVTATPGLSDYYQDDSGAELAASVPPGNPSLLRGAIESLLSDPERCERLAFTGRGFVEKQASLKVYVADITRVVRESLAAV